MKKEVNSENLEYKVRTVKLEVREAKREKDKCLEIISSGIFLFIGGFGSALYLFFIEKNTKEPWWIPACVSFGLIGTVGGFYWYNRYKKESKKIEKLEKELYLLKLKKQEKELILLEKEKFKEELGKGEKKGD